MENNNEQLVKVLADSSPDSDWIETLLKRKDEPLHPDLEPYIIQGKNFNSLCHPLVFQVPYSHASTANDAYAYKLDAVKKSLDKQDWHTYIWLHERPYRPNAFHALRKISTNISPEILATLFAKVYTDSENIFQWKNILRAYLKSQDFKLGQHALMSVSELTEFNQLPLIVTVYRGYSLPGTRKGFSWTLDEDQALWFAARYFAERYVVLKGEVAKENILAYFGDRGEQEILVDPRYVKIIEEWRSNKPYVPNKRE